MLDPLPPSTPTTIHFVLNVEPFYSTMQLSNPASITVDAILEDAVAAGPASDSSKLRLRWITDKRMALSPQQSDSIARQREARHWYSVKGHRLGSTSIASDAALQKKLRRIVTNAPVVRLYVVAPPQRAAPEGCSEVEEAHETYRVDLEKACQEKDEPTMDPNPIRAARDQSVRRKAQLKAPTYNALSPLADGTGPNAALYHPAFARMWHAYTSEENLSHVELDADMNRVVAALRYELARSRVKDDKRYLDVLKKYFAKVFPGTTFHKKYRVLRNGKLDAVLDFAVTSPPLLTA
ncbi:hypothetical protein LXA43DRAFT_120796 [Ganoderma leucocontextum]|nr:hypothetical protein LXA43DRAFT_120796 [Ganoderma leucocontextum]